MNCECNTTCDLHPGKPCSSDPETPLYPFNELGETLWVCSPCASPMTRDGMVNDVTFTAGVRVVVRNFDIDHFDPEQLHDPEIRIRTDADNRQFIETVFE